LVPDQGVLLRARRAVAQVDQVTVGRVLALQGPLVAACTALALQQRYFGLENKGSIGTQSFSGL